MMDRAIIEHDLKMAFDDGYQAGIEAAQPKWISIADRKPTKNGSYIVCSDRGAVCTAHYYAHTTYGGTVENGYFAGKIGKHVTRWMPLPEPPKEERQ